MRASALTPRAGDATGHGGGAVPIAARRAVAEPGVRIGAKAKRLPPRSCAGGDLGWQPVADRPPLRLTRRGRVVSAAVTVLVFGAAVLVVGLRAVGALPDEPSRAETVPVQVGAGQTVWSIATDTHPGEDPRVVIEQIVRLNGLRHPGDVVPGQTLVVPKP